MKVYESLLLSRISAAVRDAPPNEVLSATAKSVEFRSREYGSKQSLSEALRSAEPKPTRVFVSFHASAYDPAARQAALVNATLAVEAAKEAGLSVGTPIEVLSFGTATEWAASASSQSR